MKCKQKLNVIAKIHCYFYIIYCYTEIAQRIFKCSDIQHSSLTSDEELNSLIYTRRTLFHVNIYRSYKISEKQSGFLARHVHHLAHIFSVCCFVQLQFCRNELRVPQLYSVVRTLKICEFEIF